MEIIKINKLFLFFFICCFCGCAPPTHSIDKKILNLEISSFDVVEKEFLVGEDIPKHLKDVAESWFNKKIKVNGFEGMLIISIDQYKQVISNIDNGKKIDMSIIFHAEISKSNNLIKKKIKGEVNTHGTLIGDFSLSEFDVLILNTQTELIKILSKKIDSSF